jgi:hypothetical protein
MTHDQFHTYLRDTFGEKIRTLIIDELDIPSPRVIIDADLQFDIMERVKSMQEELKLKFVEKEGDIYVPKRSIMSVLASIQRDIEAERSIIEDKKNNKRQTPGMRIL